MNVIKQLVSYIDNPKVLQWLVILLVAIIVFMVSKIYKNMKKQLNTIITHEKDKWNNVNNKLDDIKIEIAEIKDKLKLNNETTISLVYHQCFNEAKKWQEKGYIDLGSKKYFDKMWDNYLGLGDGLGIEPKDIIDSLPIRN